MPITLRHDYQHRDELAVDAFASAMKSKMIESSNRGRGGWDNPSRCSVRYLRHLLRQHVEKGDPVDVANIAMMLWHRRTNTNGPTI